MTEKILNSRVTILMTEEGMNINRNDMTVLESIEVIQRLLLLLRSGYWYSLSTKEFVDSVEWYEWEDDKQKICVAWNPEIEKIQVAFTGISSDFIASQVLEYAVTYLQAYLINPDIGRGENVSE